MPAFAEMTSCEVVSDKKALRGFLLVSHFEYKNLTVCSGWQSSSE
jgi:hypothetical protein